MESLRVERLDHFGLIVSVIKNLRLIEMIDARLVPDTQEEITPGEAMAGMILNGLGVTNRPLSLTPQFFAHKPLDLLFREGVHAEMFNRFKLGRTLDEAYDYGCDLLLSELALGVCDQEGIDRRFNHLRYDELFPEWGIRPRQRRAGHYHHSWLLERPSA